MECCRIVSLADPPASRDLAAFVAAVASGSMGGAAEALDLTQSAVTKRIRALEARLGVALLERGRFGVRPTEAGAALYPEAKLALDALARAETLLHAHRADELAALRVAACHTVGEFLLPGWLAAYRRRAEAPRAEVRIVNTAVVIAALRDGGADLGFIEGRQAPTGLELLTVARDELLATFAPSHRWARRRSVPAQDLASEPFYTREPGSGTREVAEERLATAGVRLKPALEAASLEAVKRAAASGGGFAILSSLAIEREVAAGHLVALPVRGVSLRRELRAVRRRGGGHPVAAQRFWRWLKREVAG